MELYEIDVVIPPVGKGRPRFTRSGHTYTPKKTKDAEREIADMWKAGYPNVRFEKGVPLMLCVKACFPIPPSWGKQKVIAAMKGELWPTKRPDGDNVLKLVADALNGVAYEDDSQIVYMTIKKEYASRGFLRIRIEEYK